MADDTQAMFIHTPARRPYAPPCPAQRSFTLAWSLALTMLILNLGQVLGLGNINALEKIIFLGAAVFYLRGKNLDPVAAAGITLVLAAVMLPGFLTPFAGFSWIRALFALVALLALAAFFLAAPAPAQRRLIMVSIACTPLVLLAYGLLLALLFGRPLFMRDHTGATRLGGATIPAFLAAAAYAGTVAACFLYAQTSRLRWIMTAVAALALCTLSGTRMPSACAAVSALIILLASLRSAGARMALLATGVIVSIGFLLTAGNQILVRFLSGSSSGREKLWDTLGPWIERYPLAGVGFGHHGLLIPEHVLQRTKSAAAHNEYLRLLVELGYPGAALFLLGLLLLFLGRGLLTRARLPIATLLLCVFFLYAATDNVFYLSYALFVPLCIAFGMPLLRPDRSTT